MLGPAINGSVDGGILALQNQPCAPIKTLVLGIGNTLRRDDGVGIYVVERLRNTNIPEGTRLLDGGTAGFDVVPYLEDIDRLIIVDAFLSGATPGEIRFLDENDIAGGNCFISGHFGNVRDILDIAAAIWRRPETIIIGIVPEDCDSYEEGLSPEIDAVADEAVSIISRILHRPGSLKNALAGLS